MEVQAYLNRLFAYLLTMDTQQAVVVLAIVVGVPVALSIGAGGLREAALQSLLRRGESLARTPRAELEARLDQAPFYIRWAITAGRMAGLIGIVLLVPVVAFGVVCSFVCIDVYLQDFQQAMLATAGLWFVLVCLVLLWKEA
jgi:hypothetical protein